MAKRPHILITNDDGVYAPGIKHLWKTISEFADTTVIAPAGEQSAVGLSITIRHPLKIEKIDWASFPTAMVWSINGTPSDCIKLALSVILPSPPDLILSGINRGTNAGRNVLYSGTVAAIIEATMHEIPGIAFSLGDYHNPNFEEIEAYIPPIVHYTLKHPLPTGTFLNVNFPENRENGIKGVRISRQGKEYWMENPEKRTHPAEKNVYYWLGSQLARFHEHEESDIHWLRKGYATIVPIYVGDLTDLAYLQSHKEPFEEFIN